MTIYLASQSPRRRQLLEQIAIDFDLLSVDVDEHWDSKEHPRCYVERLALEKARIGLRKVDARDQALVIGADTSVVLDDRILGKAETPEEAAAMLRQLSGRKHDVYSAVAVASIDTTLVKTSISQVMFKPLTVDEIVTYCECGEAVGKAGGYAVQGRAAVFIERLEGSYSGVMGLPLYEMYSILREFNIDITA